MVLPPPDGFTSRRFNPQVRCLTHLLICHLHFRSSISYDWNVVKPVLAVQMDQVDVVNLDSTDRHRPVTHRIVLETFRDVD